MKNILTLLLCATLVAIPFNSSQADPPPDPEPISMVQLVVGGVIVIVASVAIYTVYKTAKATQDNCSACRQLIPAKSYSCPACGKAYRCEDCGTKLPANGTQCPKCATPIPPPKKVLKSIESSANGVAWVTAATLDTKSCVFYDELSILSFPTQEEFEAWCAAQTDIVGIKQLGTVGTHGWFRLSSE